MDPLLVQNTSKYFKDPLPRSSSPQSLTSKSVFFLCGQRKFNSSQYHRWCPVVHSTFWRRSLLHTLGRIQYTVLVWLFQDFSQDIVWRFCFWFLIVNKFNFLTIKYTVTKSTMGLERPCVNHRRYPVDMGCLNCTRPCYTIRHRFSPSYMYVWFVLPFLTEWPKNRVWTYIQTADTLYRNSRYIVSNNVSTVEDTIQSYIHWCKPYCLAPPRGNSKQTISKSQIQLCTVLWTNLYSLCPMTDTVYKNILVII